METFYVIRVPTGSGRTWRIVRNDGRGGEMLLPSVYETENEARRELCQVAKVLTLSRHPSERGDDGTIPLPIEESELSAPGI
jgi:hypothetical protein